MNHSYKEVYCKEKQKPKKSHRNLPSFSSTLLDEICRSIDEKGESPKMPPTVFISRRSSSVRSEESSRTSRACLVEKWMEHKEKERIAARKMENVDNNDVLFFSSNSSSSDSSGALSSSDTEFFSSSTCPKMPKPIRTNTSPHDENRDEETKSRSRALKIYANLKKLKQPISPGMKLTNLINSFFANMNKKKSKDTSRSKVHQEQSCSSASRSCIVNKSCENSRKGCQRTVRFDPVGVIVDQYSKPCGKKTIYDDRCGRPPLPPKVIDQTKYDDDDDDDAFSESSSDLFELDHLSFSDRFCEELPVYKTTSFGKNRGLIR